MCQQASSLQTGGSGPHVGGQQSGVWGNRDFRPCLHLLSQNLHFKSRTGDSNPYELSRTASPLWVPAKLPDLPKSNFPLADGDSNTILSVYMKHLARERPREQWLLLLLFNEFKALCQPPHGPWLLLLAKKGRQSPCQCQTAGLLSCQLWLGFPQVQAAHLAGTVTTHARTSSTSNEIMRARLCSEA